MQNVRRPILQELVKTTVYLGCMYIPFQSASQPSPRKRPMRFIMPQTPSALPTGMIYSGRVPSSSTDLRTT